MRRISNALLIPYRPADHPDAGQMLVQDRRGHRPPPWGFFGGGMEAGESSLQTVLRETWEELGVRLSPDDLQFGTEISGQMRERDFRFTLYLFTWAYSGTGDEFRQNEGAGMEWVTPGQMLTRVEAGGPDEAVCLWTRDMLR